MDLGMIVLDNEGMVLSINPAAREVLGEAITNIGEPVENYFEDKSELFDYFKALDAVSEIVVLKNKNKVRYYKFKLTSPWVRIRDIHRDGWPSYTK